MHVCALCLAAVPRLSDSHIMSKWLYRRARAPGEQNPNPVMLTDYGVVPTSKQITEHLCCEECEQRLSREGERFAAAMSFQLDGSCPLFRRLGEEPGAGGRRVVRAAEGDAERLTHFGVGTIWRASVSVQMTGCVVPPRVREQLRRFLVGATEFPSDMAMQLLVLDQPMGIERREDRWFAAPSSTLARSHHWFMGAGLYFELRPYRPGPVAVSFSLPQNLCVQIEPAELHRGIRLMKRSAREKLLADRRRSAPHR